MAEPVRRVSSGDKHFDFSGLMAHEMIQVTKWTGIERHFEFYDQIRKANPLAVQAAWALLAWRESGEDDPPRLNAARVNLDDLRVTLVVGDREVEMLFVEDADGPIVALADEQGRPVPGGKKGTWAKPTGADGEKTTWVPLTNDDGGFRYRYIDTGEEVDPTPPTPGSTGSNATAKQSGGGSGSPSPSPKEDAA